MRGGYTPSLYLVCKDLGCAEHMHKCWMPQECSRLGEIRDWQGVLERAKVRGGYTPSLTLYAKTWDVCSLCTSVGACKSVPDLERFV